MNDIQCYLARYTPDLLRQETSNVGIILQHNDDIVARFFAETFKTVRQRADSPRQRTGIGVDKKIAAKRVLHPGIYRQWIEYWRYHISRGTDGLQTIVGREPLHFAVVAGATISTLQNGTLLSLRDELFGLMVDPVNDARPDHKPQEPQLFHAIREEFLKASILATDKKQLVPYPVVAHATVSGRVDPQHQPSFVQNGPQLVVMQTVNLSHAETHKRTIGMSARSTAYMFRDVQESRRDREVKTIALVSVSPSSSLPDETGVVERAYNILLEAADEVIDCSVPEKKSQFLDGRIKAAFITKA